MREEDVIYNDNVRSIIRGRQQQILTGADTDEQLNDAPLQTKCPLSRFNILLTRRNMYVIGTVLLLMIIVIAAVTSTRSGGGLQGEPVSADTYNTRSGGRKGKPVSAWGRTDTYEPTYEPTPETTTYEPTYETTNDGGGW